MKRTKTLPMLLMVVLTLLMAAVPLLSSCQSKASTPTPTRVPGTLVPTSTPAPTPTPAPTKPAVYKIGAMRGLTGGGSWSGELLRDGGQMAIDEINAAGGVGGVPLQIITEDTQWLAQKGVEAISKLTDVDRVPVVIVGGSSVVPAVKPITEEKRVAMFIDSATIDGTDYAGTKYMAGILTTREVYSQQLADIVVKMGLKTAVITYANNAQGQGWNRQVTEYLMAHGVKVLADESHELDQKDFRTMLVKFKSLNPDAFMLLVYATGGEHMFVRQAAELGFQPKFTIATFNVITANFLPGAGGTAEGLVAVPIGYNPYDVSNTKAVDFRKKWDAKYPGRDPTLYAPYAYDGIYILAEAIRKGGYTGEGISKALRTLKDYSGVSGKLSIDPESGKPITALPDFIVSVKNGEWQAWAVPK